MSILDGRNLIELKPNPPCVLCREPIGDNYGFAGADVFCCVGCYDGLPAWPDEADS